MQDSHANRRRRRRRPSAWPTTDLEITDWKKGLERLEGAYTLRSYEGDFRLFVEWCAAEGRPALRQPRRRSRRARLKPQRPAQALGITAAIRDRLLTACSTDLAGLRDQVLVAVGFDTLCRRGELVALVAEDLAPNHHGPLSILVWRAKNDPYGTGRIAHLSEPPVRIVQSWLRAAEISGGPLLRPVYCGHPVPRFMEPYSVGRVLKNLATKADLDPAEIRQISGRFQAIRFASAPPSS